MKQYISFVKAYLLTIILGVLVVGGVNYYVDPLWCFPDNVNMFNQVQSITAEQQQKTNKFYFDNKEYETIILGSSGVSFVPASLTWGAAYNYAGAGLWPARYSEYVDFVKNKEHTPIKRIVIGVEFVETDYNSLRQRGDLSVNYIDNATSLAYRWRRLFSIATFKLSIANMHQSIKGDKARKYSRNNIHYAYMPRDKEDINKVLLVDLEGYRDVYRKYEYNKEYKAYLMRLKEENPDTEFIVYTYPTSAPMINSWKENGLWESYEKWLRDVVDVFGVVHHMQWNSSFTNDWKNYQDSNHVTNQAGEKIIFAIEHADEVDYDMVLTRDNIDEKMIRLKDNINQEIGYSF